MAERLFIRFMARAYTAEGMKERDAINNGLRPGKTESDIFPKMTQLLPEYFDYNRLVRVYESAEHPGHTFIELEGDVVFMVDGGADSIMAQIVSGVNAYMKLDKGRDPFFVQHLN